METARVAELPDAPVLVKGLRARKHEDRLCSR
jgi:hypothetical protein